MTRKKKAPAGFRWVKITTAYGERVDFLTTDMRTKKGKEIYQKAFEIMSQATA